MSWTGRIKKHYIYKTIEKQGGYKTSELARKIAKEKNKCEIGMYTYGSCFDDSFNVGGEVVIGRYTSFGPDVHYFGANHPYKFASMSPYFYQKSWGGGTVSDIERYKLEVGNDCWIGCGVIITAGCHKIGNGAVIGAGAIVTKDVAPYAIVAGNPARTIKMRFDDQTIEILEKSQWYNMKPDELLQFYSYIDEPNKFANMIIESRSK